MIDRLKTWLRRHFWVANLTLVGLLSILAGLVITNLLQGYLLVKPDKPGKSARSLRPRKRAKPRTPKFYKNRFTVASRNIFCSTCEPAKPDSDKGVASTTDAVLLATYISKDPKWCFAAVRISQPDRILMIGEGRKFGDADVVKIESKRVSLRRKGRLEYLELLKGASEKRPPKTASKHRFRGRSGMDKGIKKTGPYKYEVERRLVNEFLANAAMAGRGARIVPNVRNGKPNGFRLYAVRPYSVYYKLGIRNGDVIHSVNNQDITSPDKALEAFTKLRGASHLSISITRRGKPITMDYTIR